MRKRRFDTIDVEAIEIDESRPNRGDPKEVLSSKPFMELLASVIDEETGTPTLINPISVETIGGGRYRLIAGFRRLLAFKTHYRSGNDAFGKIDAYVYDGNVSEADRFQIFYDENQRRHNPPAIETIKAILLRVAAFSKAPNRNIYTGIAIMRGYYKLIRSKSQEKIQEHANAIVAMTENPKIVNDLRRFFETIGRSPKKLYENNVFFKFDPPLLRAVIEINCEYRLAKQVYALAKIKPEAYKEFLESIKEVRTCHEFNERAVLFIQPSESESEKQLISRVQLLTTTYIDSLFKQLKKGNVPLHKKREILERQKEIIDEAIFSVG